MEPSVLDMSILDLVTSAGYIGIFATVFAESSLFFSFFLPGSSLLFTAGVLASQGFFDLATLIVILSFAAIFGDSFGYYLGHRIGPAIFNKPDSKVFNKKHIDRTEKFYEKYGAKAVVIARFVPIVRSFVPLLAGVGSMKYRTFITYNIFGGVLWSISVTSLGYYLGIKIHNIEEVILPIVGVIILTSLIPVAYEWYKEKNNG